MNGRYLVMSALMATSVVCLGNGPQFSRLSEARTGSIKSVDPQALLYEGILQNSADVIQEAVSLGASINASKDGRDPLLWAILLNHGTAIKALLDLGFIPNGDHISHIVKNYDMETILLLVKQNKTRLHTLDIVDVFSRGIHNVDIALDLIKELINKGYSVNDLWSMAITLARYNPEKGEAAIKLMMQNGASPDIICVVNIYRNNLTPLHEAAKYLNTKVVKLLLQYGAAVNKKVNPINGGRKLYTPLAYVMEETRPSSGGRNEVIKTLLEHGATL